MFTLGLTDVGQVKIIQAALGNASLTLTKFVLGSGDGANLNSSATALQTLEREQAIEGSTVLVDGIQLAATVPTDTGGYTISEIGIVDDAGDLIAFGDFPDLYKPGPLDQATMTLSLTAKLLVAQPTSINVTVDNTSETILKYTPMTLTEAQKQQARENIGVGDGFLQLPEYEDMDAAEDDPTLAIGAAFRITNSRQQLHKLGFK